MLHILTYLLIALQGSFLHLSVTSEDKHLKIYLPISLIHYTDKFIEGGGMMAEVLKEAELDVGDTLIDIDTREEKILIVVVGKEKVLQRGERTPRWFRVEIEDRKEGNVSIKLPLWAFGVLSRFEGNVVNGVDAQFFQDLSDAIKNMGGGRLRFLEVGDKKSSVKVYIE